MGGRGVRRAWIGVGCGVREWSGHAGSGSAVQARGGDGCQCRPIARPGGVVAVWCYGTAVLQHEAANRVFQNFYHEVIGRFWPAGRRMVEEGYAGVAFPFQRVPSPSFSMNAEWGVDEMAGYCASWSATKRCREETGVDPIPALRKALKRELLEVRVEIQWPLVVHAGRLFHVEH